MDITLEVTNNQNTNIIDESDGLSLGEAIQIVIADPENSYVIEVPGDSTYNATVPEDQGLPTIFTLRGVGEGLALINVDYGEYTDQYTLGSGASLTLGTSNGEPGSEAVSGSDGEDSTNDSNDNDGELNPPENIDRIRDFEGKDLGISEAWKKIGSIDVEGDGDTEDILINPVLGRWATVGVDSRGNIDYSDYGEGGDTRVVGIYEDPLVASGEVEAGSSEDSQQRFQNDLYADNLELLDADDYNEDGLQEIYFRLGDGSAVAHTYMHADGNIQYVEYQSASDLEQYMSDNNIDEDVWEDWL